MKVAVFGKHISNENLKYLQHLINRLDELNIAMQVYEPFYNRLGDQVKWPEVSGFFNGAQGVDKGVDFLFSIGGDGTLLDTIPYVHNSGTPILGINLGRMGFLSSVSKDKIDHAIDQLIQKKYKLDQRTMLGLVSPNDLFGENGYSLNELTVYKKNPFSMLKIQATIDGEYLNSYWADGIILSTPTGSTAYSLSSGGPIVMPRSSNFVITPIATHNLTVRPIVIPDSCEIRIKVLGRIKEFFVSLDSRSTLIESSVELIIRKENFQINLVQLEDESYFKTIRKKLMWGLDIRN